MYVVCTVRWRIKYGFSSRNQNNQSLMMYFCLPITKKNTLLCLWNPDPQIQFLNQPTPKSEVDLWIPQWGKNFKKVQAKKTREIL